MRGPGRRRLARRWFIPGRRCCGRRAPPAAAGALGAGAGVGGREARGGAGPRGCGLDGWSRGIDARPLDVRPALRPCRRDRWREWWWWGRPQPMTPRSAPRWRRGGPSERPRRASQRPVIGSSTTRARRARPHLTSRSSDFTVRGSRGKQGRGLRGAREIAALHAGSVWTRCAPRGAGGQRFGPLGDLGQRRLRGGAFRVTVRALALRGLGGGSRGARRLDPWAPVARQAARCRGARRGRRPHGDRGHLPPSRPTRRSARGAPRPRRGLPRGPGRRGGLAAASPGAPPWATSFAPSPGAGRSGRRPGPGRCPLLGGRAGAADPAALQAVGIETAPGPAEALRGDPDCRWPPLPPDPPAGRGAVIGRWGPATPRAGPTGCTRGRWGRRNSRGSAAGPPARSPPSPRRSPRRPGASSGSGGRSGRAR